jgi:hypothetical protein
MQGLEIFPWHRWSKQSKILFYIIKKKFLQMTPRRSLRTVKTKTKKSAISTVELPSRAVVGEATSKRSVFGK